MSRNVVTILALGVFLIVTGMFFFVGKREAPPETDRLSICFYAYSNSPSGKTYALFTVTNRDSCDLRLLNGGSVGFSENAGLTNAHLRDLTVFYSLVGSNLCRGEAYTMFTEVPPHEARWRLTWMVLRDTLANRIEDLTPELPPALSIGDGVPDFFYYTTDWIPSGAQSGGWQDRPTPR